MLLAAMTTQGWEPGPGDPSIAGWIVFIGYLCVAVFAWRAGRRDAAQGNDPFLWRVLAGASVLLAANKQLDLHNAVASFGRSFAQAEGWYGQRRAVQLAFVILVGLAGGVAIAAALRHTQAQWRRHRLTLTGMILLIAFVFIRAASFHHLDTLFGMEWDMWRVPSVLEIVGVALLVTATRHAARSPVPRSPET